MNIQSFKRPLISVVLGLMLVSLFVAGAALAYQATEGTEPEAAQVSNSNFVSYDSATSVGLPPDDNPLVEAASSPNSPTAPSAPFHYYQVTGATLRGRNSSTEYAYDNVGCSHVTAGVSRILNTELPLPDDSVIKYLRVYYQDNNPASGIEGYITRYQPGVATADLIHAGSTNAFAGGYGFVVSAEITETVNNTPYAYTLIGWPDDANINNKICGLRVAYYEPVSFAYFLPVIKR